eukprot:Colp12_sorted_trinity150504_noHs@28265
MSFVRTVVQPKGRFSVLFHELRLQKIAAQHKRCISSTQALYNSEHADAANNRFKVLQYNVLSDRRALDLDISNTEYKYWKDRRKLVMKRIEESEASIVCLQEVDHFKDIVEDLAPLGYTGFHRVANGGNGGSSVLFKKGVFDAELKIAVDFNTIKGYSADSKLKTDVLTNNGAIAVKLKHKASGKGVVVFSTQLADNMKPFPRFLQAVALRRIIAELNGSKAAGLPVVVCGDFSSGPRSLAATYFRLGDMAGHIEGENFMKNKRGAAELFAQVCVG